MEYKVFLSTKVNPFRLEPGSGIMALEPEDYTVDQIKAIKGKGYKVLGYVSVGTIEMERPWWKEFSNYKLKRLPDWPKEFYMDVREEAWQAFLINRAREIQAMGFDGWWLDNIDVYSEYKSKKMFRAIGEVLRKFQALGDYVMINGGSEWLDDAIDQGEKLTDYIQGYTQEEVFSLIDDYDGKGKFGIQEAEDTFFYTGLIIKAIRKKVDCFLLEYTRDSKLKEKIEAWCRKYGASCCVSENVDL